MNKPTTVDESVKSMAEIMEEFWSSELGKQILNQTSPRELANVLKVPE